MEAATAAAGAAAAAAAGASAAAAAAAGQSGPAHTTQPGMSAQVGAVSGLLTRTPTGWAGPITDVQMAMLREQTRQYTQIMHNQSQHSMNQPVPPPEPRYRCEDLSLSELKLERERISRGYREAALQLLRQDPNPSVSTQIRIKQLQLLPLQHQVRAELSRIFEKNHGQDAILQWFEGKKRFKAEVEKHIKRAAKAKLDEAKKQTKITRGFFDDMFKHGDRMRELVKKSKQTARRDRTKVDKWHNDRVRDDKKLEDKRQKERIQALRDNDEEKYLALLKDSKNERLNHLMKETEAHLELLTTKMQIHTTDDKEAEAEGAEVRTHASHHCV